MSAPEETPEKKQEKKVEFNLSPSSSSTKKRTNKKQMSEEERKEYEREKRKEYRLQEKQKKLKETQDFHKAVELNKKYEIEINDLKNLTQDNWKAKYEDMKMNFYCCNRNLEHTQEELYCEENLREELLEAYHDKILELYSKLCPPEIHNEDVVKEYLKKNDDKFLKEYLEKIDDLENQIKKMDINKKLDIED